MALVSIRGGEGHAERDNCSNALKLYTIRLMTVWGREVLRIEYLWITS
jgi:hypothetical protein